MMNTIIQVLGWVLVLGGLFGFGVLFVRFYDDWKMEKHNEFKIQNRQTLAKEILV